MIAFVPLRIASRSNIFRRLDTLFSCTPVERRRRKEMERGHYQHFPIPFDGPKVVRSTKSHNSEKRCRSKSDFNKITTERRWRRRQKAQHPLMRCISSLRQAFSFPRCSICRRERESRVRRHSRCVRPSATVKHPFCRQRHQPHTPSCRHNSAKRKKRRHTRKYLSARPVHLPTLYI